MIRSGRRRIERNVVRTDVASGTASRHLAAARRDAAVGACWTRKARAARTGHGVPLAVRPGRPGTVTRPAGAGSEEPLAAVSAGRARGQRGSRSPSHPLRIRPAAARGNITGLRARDGEVHVGTVAVDATRRVRSMWPCVLWRHFVHCGGGRGTAEGRLGSALLVAVWRLRSCGAGNAEMKACENFLLGNNNVLFNFI